MHVFKNGVYVGKKSITFSVGLKGSYYEIDRKRSEVRTGDNYGFDGNNWFAELGGDRYDFKTTI